MVVVDVFAPRAQRHVNRRAGLVRAARNDVDRVRITIAGDQAFGGAELGAAAVTATRRQASLGFERRRHCAPLWLPAVTRAAVSRWDEAQAKQYGTRP